MFTIKHRNREYIFNPDTLEIYSENSDGKEERSVVYINKLTLSHLYLELTYKCNFHCEYCFTDFGGYYDKGNSMSFETAKNAIDFLLIGKSCDNKDLLLTFFGGEPLLEFRLIKRIVEYGNEISAKSDKRIKYQIITNGSLLTKEVLEFLNKNRIFVQINIDGTRNFHDYLRHYKEGQPSYSIILKNLKEFCNYDFLRKNFALRGTYIPGFYSYKKLAMFLRSFEPLSILINPVVYPHKENKLFFLDKEKSEVHCKELEEFYKALYSHILSMKKPFYSVEIARLRALLSCSKEIFPYYCGAGKGHLSIGPDGKIYPCFAFSGDDSFCCGDVNKNKFDENAAGFNKLNINNDIKEREECRKCIGKNICKGGCAHVNYLVTGSIYKPDNIRCEIERFRIKKMIKFAIDFKRQSRVAGITEFIEQKVITC